MFFIHALTSEGHMSRQVIALTRGVVSDVRIATGQTLASKIQRNPILRIHCYRR